MENLNLSNDFEPGSEAEWLTLAEKALNGATFETLRTPLYEGFALEPLYSNKHQSSNWQPLFSHRGWTALQPLRGSAQDAKRQCDEAKAASVTGFWLDFSNDGLQIETAQHIADLLSPLASVPSASFYLAGDVDIAHVAFFLSAFPSAISIRGSAGLDPISRVAKTGQISADRDSFFSNSVDAALFLRRAFPEFIPFLVSDRVWHGAGSSAVQELAFSLAAGVSYCRALLNGGKEIADAFSSIAFSLTATADIFLTIAKFRAMRLLWAHTIKAANNDEAPPPLHLVAETSSRIMTIYDRHNNLLRGTAAAFSASLGGANAICVYPHDKDSGPSSASSNRFARNINYILSCESHLDAVSDAAHGSWYVEDLTYTLAAQAWALFQDVEKRGGLLTALESGFVHHELQRVKNAREKNTATRKDKITGVSAFPNLKEQQAVLLDEPLPVHGFKPHLIEKGTVVVPKADRGERLEALWLAARRGSGLADLKTAYAVPLDPIAKPITASRQAEPFEILRQNSDVALAKLGSRPPVFLATLGKPEDYRSRALWVESFFGSGGIETQKPEKPLSSQDELVAAFRQSSSPVVCLCSSDATYASLPGIASSLKEAGASFIYLVGSPVLLKNLEPRDARACDRLLYEGCDAAFLLHEAHDILHVQHLSDLSDDEE